MKNRKETNEILRGAKYSLEIEKLRLEIEVLKELRCMYEMAMPMITALFECESEEKVECKTKKSVHPKSKKTAKDYNRLAKLYNVFGTPTFDELMSAISKLEDGEDVEDGEE